MSPFRSPRALAAAALAATCAVALAVRSGAPWPLSAAATLGGDRLSLGGGAVVDVRLPASVAPGDAGPILAAVRARLGAFGPAGGPAVTEPGHVTFELPGADADRATRAAADLALPVVLQFREVVEDGPLAERLATTPPPAGVHLEDDTWHNEENDQTYRSHYLSSRDPAALARAVAALGTDPAAEILLERVTPDPAAKDRRPFERTWVVARQVILDDRSVAEAQVGWDPNVDKPVVYVDFTPAGAQAVGDFTRSHIGHKLAIVLDGRVSSAPVINTAITGGRAVITMGRSDPVHMQEEAEDLVTLLAHAATLPPGIVARVVQVEDGSAVRRAIAAGLGGLLAALLVLALAWAAGRWSLLRPAAASRGPIVGERRWGPVLGAGLVTVAVVAGLAALRWIDVPGLDNDELAGPLVVHRAGTSIAALGITPIVLAYVLVELVASLVPGGKRRRRGGRAARAPLVRATAAVAGALTIGYAWFVARSLTAIDDGWAGPPWLAIAALAAGVLACAIGAAVIERRGLGQGWSVVLAATYGPDLWDLARGAGSAAGIAALAGAALIGVVAVIATRTRIAAGDDGPAARLPLGGLAAAAVAPMVVLLLGTTLTFLPQVPGLDRLAHLVDAAVDWITVLPLLNGLVGAGVVAVVLGALWGGRLSGRAHAGAIALSAALALILIAIGALDGAGVADGLAVALVAATAVDVAVEARARVRGPWVEVDQVHDVDRADELLAAGGPRWARGVHTRALYRFFLPMVPVTIYARPDEDDQRQAARATPATARA